MLFVRFTLCYVYSLLNPLFARSTLFEVFHSFYSQSLSKSPLTSTLSTFSLPSIFLISAYRRLPLLLIHTYPISPLSSISSIPAYFLLLLLLIRTYLFSPLLYIINPDLLMRPYLLTLYTCLSPRQVPFHPHPSRV